MIFSARAILSGLAPKILCPRFKELVALKSHPELFPESYQSKNPEYEKASKINAYLVQNGSFGVILDSREKEEQKKQSSDAWLDLPAIFE